MQLAKEALKLSCPSTSTEKKKNLGKATVRIELEF